MHKALLKNHKDALQKNTTANYNTAVGQLALNENTTASNNTAVGYNALGLNTTCISNVAIGPAAADATADACGDVVK